MKLFDVNIAHLGQDLGFLVAANSKEEAMMFRGYYGKKPNGAEEIATVKDKDGNAYAVVLLPQYKLEDAKLIRKQTEVRCDEPGCDWSLNVEPESVLEWHNVRCPNCNRGVIINDNEAEVFRQILAASEPDAGEKGLLEIEVDTAMLREAKTDEA